jgi:hypothetical protein
MLLLVRIRRPTCGDKIIVLKMSLLVNKVPRAPTGIMHKHRATYFMYIQIYKFLRHQRRQMHLLLVFMSTARIVNRNLCLCGRRKLLAGAFRNAPQIFTFDLRGGPTAVA